MRNIILEKLKEIEEKENVKIIAAVESGSRAWGFSSPDSDYDVRFIYVRQLEDYLRLDKIRDVIEWQLDDVLDINGWDLKKALQLMHDSNPTIFEWCASPILYKSSDEFLKLKKIRPDYFSVKKSLYHYWHMASNNYQAYLQGEEVKIKKYFYVIRPLLAAEWIVKKGIQPPMLFSELMSEMLPDYLQGKVNELLEMKQIMPEMGMAPRIKILDEYIEKELASIKNAAAQAEQNRTDWKLLNQYFYDQVRRI
ncbi:MAG: nucleotidyltransferase domain-containing protein [Lachnospiraceae bacterium]|nr:nucleotidyltransferase domain-containing protein [Lachnospiraceae bacterium]